MTREPSFAALLEKFFIQRLMHQRQASVYTIASYRDTFRLLLDFVQRRLHKAPSTLALEDIDAPETYQHKCDSELALGNRATNRLLELINFGPFELVNRGGRDEDRYGRKLRTIERGGRSLGEILVAEGLARRWDGARRSWCG